MHIPHLMQKRFENALESMTSTPEKYASMIRSTSDPNHGDFQVNLAMPLSKELGKPPRDVAGEVVGAVDVADVCEPPEIAGPGFINLKLKDDFIAAEITKLIGDARCGVPKRKSNDTIVIDFSSPNVAKPMHVGHIRSTVIGDSLARVLNFLGYNTITDNHLGDWGTQFGIIIYGYKHFGDPKAVAADPVPELAKLYRKVNSLIEFCKAKKRIPQLTSEIESAKEELAQLQSTDISSDPKAEKKHKKSLAGAERKIGSLQSELSDTQAKIDAVEQDPQANAEAIKHADIDKAVLEETAKLHRGDEENLKLWEEFLPNCKDEINRVYDRLGVTFDHTLGESFYHKMLGVVVSELEAKGLASTSDGAVCVFLDAFDAPMIVRKQDGAYLYATTDLATLRYRQNEFKPTEILYVVDTRQSEHFDKIFAVAHEFGLKDVKLVHVNFGTVLGEDGRPMKTRSGTLIGLEGLLDDAVERARQVVCDPERLKNFDPPMDAAEQEMVAETVGIGAIKFADLSHHRTSDYKFSLDKMIALEGNTSTYVQYSYARTQAILTRAEKLESDVYEMVQAHGITFTHPAERTLAVSLLRLEEALLTVHKDYAPNVLVEYLLDTARNYSRFNDNCHVLKAETEAIQATRLALVTLSGRVLQLGLSLLGVDVVGRM
ncbi:Arginine--tRNA ligase [Rubripirellula amarantea]|uniref:Arginine--tRNA ligase n=1 Tax=Rubripirellula amarantea TaxID=2527999 RepID=A0A5C5WRN8_9BACT|nr:arginine--tRNA ligase [Rubripirellula amarantea]TWT52801.1 Arginine--tRNA ligase [Rubripirellula amarantea]